MKGFFVVVKQWKDKIYKKISKGLRELSYSIRGKVLTFTGQERGHVLDVLQMWSEINFFGQRRGFTSVLFNL